jgi:hypothetical protein
MEAQVDAAPDTEKPAFFYNLGDVVYFNGQSIDYSWQFYEPYQYYQPYIFAIAGNHDGDTHVRRNDPPVNEPTLTGFMNNFCADSPEPVPTYHRSTMTQPYVYWTLESPFLTIIGLYSNVDGSLDGHGTYEQQGWLRDQLHNAHKTNAYSSPSIIRSTRWIAPMAVRRISSKRWTAPRRTAVACPTPSFPVTFTVTSASRGTPPAATSRLSWQARAATRMRLRRCTRCKPTPTAARYRRRSRRRFQG